MELPQGKGGKGRLNRTKTNANLAKTTVVYKAQGPGLAGLKRCRCGATLASCQSIRSVCGRCSTVDDSEDTEVSRTKSGLVPKEEALSETEEIWWESEDDSDYSVGSYEEDSFCTFSQEA